MTEDEIFVKIKEIFQDILDDELLEIGLDSTPKEIDGWDSVVNIDIVFAVEAEFDVKFGLEGIQSISKVSDVLRLVKSGLEK